MRYAYTVYYEPEEDVRYELELLVSTISIGVFFHLKPFMYTIRSCFIK